MMDLIGMMGYDHAYVVNHHAEQFHSLRYL
jgi:hypothetical protein